LKVKKRYLLIIFFLFLFTGCSQNSTEQETFVIWASNENMNDELREALFNCLDNEKIEYQVDNEKNVLIKNKDVNEAVARCS
jgi:PBP1b-binding outer membrane lipoprotein LpoB